MKYCARILLIALIATLSQVAVAQRTIVRTCSLSSSTIFVRKVAAYGDQVVLTPNIDDLANTGVMFEQAFAAVPNCGASRAALFSARKPTTSRFITYDSRLDEDLPDAVNLPGYFQSHGYHTVSNGKVFDATLDTESAWSETPWNPEGDWTSSMAPNARRDDIQACLSRQSPGRRRAGL